MNLKINKGDIFGGVTAGVVALPLALAFGVQSGLGAAAGLFGAIFLGFFAAILGGTPTQVSGPTGPMTVVTAATVASLIDKAGSLELAFGAILLTFILTGVFQILMGTLKLGMFIKYIPYPVISGFMTGIGLIIILLQIFPALGHKSPSNTLAVVMDIAKPLADINYPALLYCLLTMAIVFVFPKITKAVPSTLVALILVSILSVVLPYEVPLIGTIPTGIPMPQIAALLDMNLQLFQIAFSSAITLAALGAIDSLLTSVVADNITKTQHDSNRELIGQGVGNAVAGLFGGLPGAGATMRTVVNVNAGGKTRISGAVHSLVLLLVLLGAAKYAAMIPLSVLAGILFTVGWGILDSRGLRQIKVIPRTDAIIMLVVLAITVFVDLLTAVGVGLILASVFFVKNISDHLEKDYESSSLEDLKETAWADEHMPKELQRTVFVKHLDGPLFFGFVSHFKKMVSALPEVKYVIIRMGKVPFIDQSGLYALEEAIIMLEAKGIEVIIVRIQSQPRTLFENIRIIPNLVGEDNLVNSFEDAVKIVRGMQKGENLG